MRSLFDLTGKRAPTTGSMQGIGNLLANGLVARGAEIVINDITQQHAQAAANKLVAESYRATDYGSDVADGEEATCTTVQIEREAEAIDILINNTGIQRRCSFTEFSEAEWDKVTGANQKSAFLMSQQASRCMVQHRRGKITNTYLMQSGLGRKAIILYAAPKDAVKMLTRGMCMELTEYNIQVNGIASGCLAADTATALVNDEAFSAWLLQRTPAACWGNPEELTSTAACLTAPASDFTDRYLLFVDGGTLAAA